MSSDISSKNKKLQQITKLLKFLITLDDIEIIKHTLESVVEILEEENTQNIE